jgi:hypothetical protein
MSGSRDQVNPLYPLAWYHFEGLVMHKLREYAHGTVVYIVRIIWGGTIKNVYNWVQFEHNEIG